MTAPTQPRRPTRGLRFNIGVPVAIHWSFLIVPALLLLSGQRPWNYSLGFTAVLFISVLVHELGHAAAFSAFGRRSRIVLYAPFALTISEDDAPMSDLQGCIVALAGPLAGVGLGLLALWGEHTGMGATHQFTAVMLRDTVMISLVYGLLNLVPILPLDGGQVMERITRRLTGGAQAALPHWISIGVAASAALLVSRLDIQGPWLIYGFIGFLVMLNLQLGRQVREDEQQTAAVQQAERALAGVTGPHGDLAINDLCGVLPKLSRARREQFAQPLMWALARRFGPGDDAWLAWIRNESGATFDQSFVNARVALAAGRPHEAASLATRAYAIETTPPPPWLVEVLLPNSAAVDSLAAWIDQLGLGERHQGLHRLADSLEGLQRRADASRVRALMLKPVPVDPHTAPERAWV
jgi:Zn-dependent protease